MAPPAPQKLDGFTRLGEIDVERRAVFVRADLDAPVADGGALLDDAKLIAAVPTLRHLLEREARVIVGAHRTRSPAVSPAAGDAASEEVDTLEPSAARLAELLETEVYLPDRSTGLLARKLKNELRPGRLLVLENLLRDPREQAGDLALARDLAEGIEVYVGDCLAGPHASVSIAHLPRLVHERAIGLRFEEELVAANRLRHAWGRGMVLLLGGRFLERRALLDHVLQQPGTELVAMGDLAETLGRARTGSDPNDRDASELAQARSWLQKASSRGFTLELGRDEASRQRAIDALTRARSTLVLGRAASGSTDGGLLAAALRGTGFLLAGHTPEFRELLAQPGRSRSVFVSTAPEAMEALLCEQKLAGVEALRRAP